MSVVVDLAVECADWDTIPDLQALLERSVGAAQAGAGVRLADRAEVSVLLCDDATIRALNRDWRGLDKATNVLSFPAAMPKALGERPLLGDIAVAWETTRREALDEGKPIAAHLTHLVVHGFLHVVGFDHETSDEAETMEALEVKVLATLGLPDPYADADLVEAQAS